MKDTGGSSIGIGCRFTVCGFELKGKSEKDFRILNSGFRVKGIGLKSTWGFSCRSSAAIVSFAPASSSVTFLLGIKCRVQGLGFRVKGLGFRV